MMENNLVAQIFHPAMGTVMPHNAFGLYAEASLDAVCSEVARIEERLSRFLPGSDVARVNGAAGIKSERLSLETYTVLSKAVEFSRLCPGCFDVTIAPLVALWQRARESLTQPDASSIQQVLPL